MYKNKFIPTRPGLAGLIIALLLLLTNTAHAGPADPGDSPPAPGGTLTTTLTILHTSNTFGQVGEDEQGAMGFGKVSALAKEFRAQSPYTLLLDAGDTLHGKPFAYHFKGDSIIQLMNAMGYDAMVAGNHDLNYGQEQLKKLDAVANFPILAANIYLEDGNRLLNPYLIKELGELRVAIFGLATPETLYKTHPRAIEGLTFADTVETATEMVEELKGKADIIIALGHLGIDEHGIDTSLRVAENVPGIDLFIDSQGQPDPAEEQEQGIQVGDTLIVNPGNFGHSLGVVELTISGGEIIEKKARVIHRAEVADLPPDAGIIQLIEGYKEKLAEKISRTVGVTRFFLEGGREMVRTRETNLGNLVTDAVLQISGADAALLQGGSIRGSLETGEISWGDLITVFPFENTIEVKKVTGAQLKEALEHGTSDFPEPKGAFPQVAGINFTIVLDRPVGDRLINIKIQGQPLELDREYTLATNDFLAAGGDDYHMLEETPTVGEYLSLVEALASYIKEKGTIEYQAQGRIRVIETQEPQPPGDEITTPTHPTPETTPRDWYSRFVQRIQLRRK